MRTMTFLSEFVNKQKQQQQQSAPKNQWEMPVAPRPVDNSLVLPAMEPLPMMADPLEGVGEKLDRAQHRLGLISSDGQVDKQPSLSQDISQVKVILISSSAHQKFMPISIRLCRLRMILSGLRRASLCQCKNCW